MEETVEKRSAWVAIAFVVVSTGLELTAFLLGGLFSVVASRFWVISGVFCLVASLGLVVRGLARDLRERQLLGLLALLTVFAFVFTQLDWTSLEGGLADEGTREMEDTFRLAQRADLGFQQVAFGYPTRHLLPSALPTWLLGRRIESHYLGFTLPFAWGLAVFHAGLVTHLRERRFGPLLAALATLLLVTTRFTVFYLRQAEQSSLPLSYTLLTAGGLLLCLERLTAPRAVLVFWAGALLAANYTPALASLGLLLSVLGLLAVGEAMRRRWLSTTLLLAALAGLSVILAVWLAILRQTYFVEGRLGSMEAPAALVERGLVELVGAGEGGVFFGPLLAVPMLAYLALALLFRFGFRHFLVAAWSLVTVAAAVVLRGYANPLPDFALHRAMVVLPPLLWGLSVVLAKGLEKIRVPSGRVASAAVFAAMLWPVSRVLLPNLPSGWNRQTPVAYWVAKDGLAVTERLGWGPGTAVLWVWKDEHVVFDQQAWAVVRYLRPAWDLVRVPEEGHAILRKDGQPVLLTVPRSIWFLPPGSELEGQLPRSTHDVEAARLRYVEADGTETVVTRWIVTRKRA